MDRYLLNDILEERDYSTWKVLIDEVNKEYHDKLYYGTGGSNCECLRCRKCRAMLWNWRYYDIIGIEDDDDQVWIYNVYINKSRCCYYYKGLDIELPKNY